MRILSVTAYWPPHRGGIETVAWEQAHRLARRGHEVSVLTSQLDGDPACDTSGGVALHRIAASNRLEERRGIPYPVFSPRLVPRLAQLVRCHDVVLIHNHSYLSSVASAVIARMYRRPIVLIQYNPFVEYGFPWNVVEHAADVIMGQPTLRGSSRILAISKHTRRYVEQLVGNRPVEILHLGVDTQRFTPPAAAAEKREVRGKFGLPREAFVVSTVRRLVFRNGLDTLLAAALQLREERDIVVVIGGRGPERLLLERFIEQEQLENVHLVGFVSDDDLPDLYRTSDAFVLPSRTGEGFGLVLLEAFSSGIPAIATRGGGQEDVMLEGTTGFFVPPDAPGALAAAIRKMRDDPEMLEAMSLAARRRALDRDWECSVDQLTDVLSEVVEAGPGKNSTRVARREEIVSVSGRARSFESTNP